MQARFGQINDFDFFVLRAYMEGVLTRRRQMVEQPTESASTTKRKIGRSPAYP